MEARSFAPSVGTDKASPIDPVSQPIIDRHDAVPVKILAEPGVKAQFAKQGAEAAPGTPAAFGSYITAEITRWK